MAAAEGAGAAATGAGAIGDVSKISGATAAEGVKKAGDALKGLFGGDKKKQ